MLERCLWPLAWVQYHRSGKCDEKNKESASIDNDKICIEFLPLPCSWKVQLELDWHHWSLCSCILRKLELFYYCINVVIQTQDSPIWFQSLLISHTKHHFVQFCCQVFFVSIINCSQFSIFDCRFHWLQHTFVYVHEINWLWVFWWIIFHRTFLDDYSWFRWSCKHQLHKVTECNIVNQLLIERRCKLRICKLPPQLKMLRTKPPLWISCWYVFQNGIKNNAHIWATIYVFVIRFLLVLYWTVSLSLMIRIMFISDCCLINWWICFQLTITKENTYSWPLHSCR